MTLKRIIVLLAVLGVAAVAMVTNFGPSGGFGPQTRLHIVSGSENRALEPIITEWGADNRVDVEVTYLGSVDISRELGLGKETQYDAVWPAHSLWIELGDSQKVVKHRESILRSPVVLGIRQSVAEDLGWIGRDDIAGGITNGAIDAFGARIRRNPARASASCAQRYRGAHG